MGEMTCQFCNEEKKQSLIDNILLEHNCPVCGNDFIELNQKGRCFTKG